MVDHSAAIRLAWERYNRSEGIAPGLTVTVDTQSEAWFSDGAVYCLATTQERKKADKDQCRNLDISGIWQR
ncbi:hypothetical protein [Nostoc sp. FACHB-133]|uniref:hypothetical protein n=1 Tax=Nostoc sp. FACHB-133 TaxID=2692835 RepID=UPI0016855A4B|nr:hypothetical protein [Nostoc sp. FACHB-133]MBD2526240.1 hypothetical protein [Nostoc sp. FACHB-133]